MTGSAETARLAGGGSRSQFRDASSRLAGSEVTSGGSSAPATATRRDASGRLIGSSTGNGKCHVVVRNPVPPQGFRHYVQALLLRKLIWERVPSEKIAALMAGRSTAETKQLLFDGIEIVARQSDGSGRSSSAPATGEIWNRVGITPGIELHLRGDLRKPKPAELKQIIALLETALRKNL